MRAALYARYSSDQQRAASIADQLRDCRVYAERQSWVVVGEYHDAALSGASLLRPGIQALIRDGLAHGFDVVIAESLDRFSRDQEDTAAFHKRMAFAGIVIVTIAEGEIGHLHVGLKGTMNALYLKDLADKTRRGLRGRVEAGKSGGGRCYGYRVGAHTGEREIVPDEAAVVVRIFQEYAAGRSPEAIGKRLNGERIAGPGGRTWGPSTIHGHVQRGTGILNNELYIGRLVWNRQHFLKDPDTGRRVARLNPPEQWLVADVPELRIVPADLWDAAKARQRSIRAHFSSADRRTTNQGTRLRRTHRPVHLFSGMLRCGICGRSYTTYGGRLACSGQRERGICTNTLTIRREEIESRVLTALETRLPQDKRFALYCEKVRAAFNEARMEARAAATARSRELGQVNAEIAKLLRSIKDGVPASLVRDDAIALEARKTALEREVDQPPEIPPLLHATITARWAVEIRELRRALAEDACNPNAREAVRSLVDEIRLTPRDGKLAIDVKGNLGSLFAAANPEGRRPLVTLVAGARSRRDEIAYWLAA